MNPYIFALATLFMLPGMFLVLIPGIPGLLYMLSIAFVYGFIDGFTHLTLGEIGIMAAVMGGAMLFELIASMVGARWGGARWSSLAFGAGGFVIGSILVPLPLIGGVVGLFLGILLNELRHTHDMRKAGKAALWGVGGSIVSIVVNMLAAVTIFVLFLVFVLV